MTDLISSVLIFGGLVVKSLPCNVGDVGSIPGWGTKIPYAAEQLIHVPCIAT